MLSLALLFFFARRMSTAPSCYCVRNLLLICTEKIVCTISKQLNLYDWALIMILIESRERPQDEWAAQKLMVDSSCLDHSPKVLPQRCIYLASWAVGTLLNTIEHPFFQALVWHTWQKRVKDKRSEMAFLTPSGSAKKKTWSKDSWRTLLVWRPMGRWGWI